jgi:hypothetical protein
MVCAAEGRGGGGGTRFAGAAGACAGADGRAAGARMAIGGAIVPDGRDVFAEPIAVDETFCADAREAVGGGSVPAGAERRDSGGIVVPRGGLAVRMRTGSPAGCCEVACGARERGSGAISPALGGMVDVIRGGCIDPNKSPLSPGFTGGGDCVPCTRLINSLTAVDSVFAMRCGELPIGVCSTREKRFSDPFDPLADPSRKHL